MFPILALGLKQCKNPTTRKNSHDYWNGKTILGVIAVADEVRETSKNVIQKLHQLGIKQTIMLTGDNQGTANAIGTHVGVSDIQSELMPQDKLDYIKNAIGV